MSIPSMKEKTEKMGIHDAEILVGVRGFILCGRGLKNLVRGRKSLLEMMNVKRGIGLMRRDSGRKLQRRYV